jgi:hypothetical protein
MHFLDRFVPAIVGRTNWKMNRVTKALSHFSISDEVFLLLCYDCYSEKWVADYKRKLQLTKQYSTKRSASREEEQ